MQALLRPIYSEVLEVEGLFRNDQNSRVLSYVRLFAANELRLSRVFQSEYKEREREGGYSFRRSLSIFLQQGLGGFVVIHESLVAARVSETLAISLLQSPHRNV